MFNILTLPTGIKLGNFEIRFYALFILAGAIIAYLLSRYFVKKAGYDDKILEGTFYLAFPMGIVGARIWYVIAEWSKEFASQPFYKVFAIWEGGLAIQGGAILGILVGVLYVHHRKPNYNVLAIADYVVPNILLAQAIGRWGNFFNQEVYGKACDVGGWKILGSTFVEQMTINGEFRQPLFLIEGIVNVLGFVVLFYVVRLLLKKYLRPGYLVAGYLIWYGLTRVILEPLRDSQYKMGNNIMASQAMAYVFIVLGIGLIFCFYFLDKYLKNRTKDVPEKFQNYIEKRDN